MIRVVILVDGAFYVNRYHQLFKYCSDYKIWDTDQASSVFRAIIRKHLQKSDYLFRILYYDCAPLTKRVHNPITGKCIDFSKTDMSVFRLSLFSKLKQQRKVALRLGHVKDHTGWVIKPDITKQLLNGKTSISDLLDNHVYYDITQKGVDMKIGLDIASLAYKRLVEKIILISGDSDFVPAAKVARREGIDFVLDPMWNHIDERLLEHIDGLRSSCPSRDKMPDTIEEFVSRNGR